MMPKVDAELYNRFYCLIGRFQTHLFNNTGFVTEEPGVRLQNLFEKNEL